MPTESRARGIVARGVSKTFRGSVALAGADVDVASGGITGLTGANGAGKTTLLRVLATLLTPDAGSASIDGYDVRTEAARVRERIGVALVNDRGLYWRLSGTQNLVFFARALGMSKSAARVRAAEVAEIMDIAAIARRPVASYSAGQRQRLILARAALGEPTALLVDEPLRGLDDDGIARVRDVLRANAARGAAVLVAAPTLGEIEDICDEVVVLAGGAVADRRARLARETKSPAPAQAVDR